MYKAKISKTKKKPKQSNKRKKIYQIVTEFIFCCSATAGQGV